MALPTTRGRPRLSTLQKSLNQYYRDLGKLDTTTTARVDRAFRKATRQIELEQSRILAEIKGLKQSEITPNMLYQLGRLDALGNQARHIATQFGTDVASAIESAQSGATVVSERYIKNSIQNFYGGDAAVAAGFNQLPAPAITELVGNLSDGAPLASLAQSFGSDASSIFQAQMIKGISQGLNPNQVAKNFQAAFGVSQAKARTIARTEMMRVSREASRRSMDNNADVVNGWQWFCTVSDRTCPMCWAMHGKKFKTKERMATHPNCRCAMLPILKPYRELGIPIDEPIEHSTLTTSGPDLFKKQPLELQQKVLGPAAFKAYKTGVIDLPDFIGEVNNPIWGKTRYAKSLSQILGRTNAKTYYSRPARTQPSKGPAQPKTNVLPAQPKPPKWQPSMSRTDAERWASQGDLTRPLFHVTDAANVQSIMDHGFDLERKSWGRVWGNGVYASDSLESASFYSSAFYDSARIELRVFSRKTLHIDFSGLSEYDANRVNVIKKAGVEPKYRELLDKYHGQNNSVQEEMIRRWPSLPGESLDSPRQQQRISWLNDQRASGRYTGDPDARAYVEALESSGYDAIDLRDEPFRTSIGGNQVIVFDPKRVVVVKDE